MKKIVLVILNLICALFLISCSIRAETAETLLFGTVEAPILIPALVVTAPLGLLVSLEKKLDKKEQEKRKANYGKIQYNNKKINEAKFQKQGFDKTAVKELESLCRLGSYEVDFTYVNPNANKEIIKNTQNFLLKNAKSRRLEYEKILTDLNNSTSQESKLFKAYTQAEMQKDEKYYKEHFPKDTLLLERLKNNNLDAKKMLYAKTKAMRKYEETFTYLSSWNTPNIWSCHKILVISNQEPPEPFAKNEYIVQDEQFLEEYLKEEFYQEVLKQQVMYLDTLAENKQNFNTFDIRILNYEYALFLPFLRDNAKIQEETGEITEISLFEEYLSEIEAKYSPKKAVIYSEVDYILKQNGKTLTCKDLGLF